MRYQVEIQTNSQWNKFTGRLDLAARQTLTHQSAESGALTIVLTDGETIRALNSTFAGEDRPTDVLSFSDGSEDPESGQIYLGDVVIAVDIAEKQALNAGHALINELILLTVHGVLHLLGHDHASQDEKRKMWSAQEEILEVLDIKLGNLQVEDEQT